MFWPPLRQWHHSQLLYPMGNMITVRGSWDGFRLWPSSFSYLWATLGTEPSFGLLQVWSLELLVFLKLFYLFSSNFSTAAFKFFLKNSDISLFWTAELLPPKVRSIANSIIICFAFLCGFLIAKTFVDLLEGLGQSGTFFLYGAICVIGTLLTALFVPETRGKSIEEIQRFYNRSPSIPRTEAAAENMVENTPLQTIRA